MKYYWDFYQGNKGGYGGMETADLIDLEPNHKASWTIKLKLILKIIAGLIIFT